MKPSSLVVFRKEVVDNLRDRRSVLSALLYPLLGPAVSVMVLVFVSQLEQEKAEKPLRLPAIGIEHATELSRFLVNHDVIIEPGPADPETAVKQGAHDVVLVIPSSFGEQLRASRPAEVQLVVDNSRQQAHSTIRRAKALLSAYGAQLGRLRLLVRGVDPQIVDAIAVELTDVSTPESQAAMLLAMLPYLILLSVFLGGLYVAIDTTAGELERGSLEALLSNPVSRSSMVAGKLGATFVFSVVALVVTVLAFAVVPHIISAEALGIKLRLDPMVLLAIFALQLPVALLASALQMLVATYSRSFKEAQTLLSILMLIPMIPGMMLMIAPFKAQLWMMTVPTLSQQLLTLKMLRGDPVDGTFVLVCSLSTVIISFVIYMLSVWLFTGQRAFSRR